MLMMMMIKKREREREKEYKYSLNKVCINRGRKWMKNVQKMKDNNNKLK